MLCFQSFCCFSFLFLNAQRFGIKWWFTEALRCNFNHLQPTLAKIVVQIIALCLFSLDLSWEKLCCTVSTTSRAVPAPGRCKLLAATVGTSGVFITVCSDRQPSRPCHRACHSHALRRSPQREGFCPDICPHQEYLPITSVALSEAVPLY